MSDLSAYTAFAERLLDTGVLTDPWIDGQPRFREAPVLLSSGERDSIYDAAERVAAAYDELCRLCARDPSLLDDFFELTPFQKLMWAASRPLWHGVARADVFFTREGLSVCELNCDTPTGQPEAVLLGKLTEGRHAGSSDPNARLGDATVAMVDMVARASLDDAFYPAPNAPRRIGLLYPTEMPEDLSLVRLYRQWFEAAGYAVTLGSPFNLTPTEDGPPRLFDDVCPIIVRHYKTDWWGERLPVWDDAEPLPDPLPLAGPLRVVLEASLERRCAVINPFGAVLPQNKRSMALFWEHLSRFSPASQATIRAFVPLTMRLSSVPRDQLVAEREQWVLKSDYGAEGDEVIVGKHTTPEVWLASLDHALPGRWVVQRYFEARLDAEGASTNLGVYLVGGEAAGIYARVQKGPTDAFAASAPVLVTG